MTDLFEVAMLLCFGASWPVAVVKAYKARTAKGVSLLSSSLILMGYLFGILYKVTSNNINYVLIFYVFNFSIVLTHCILIYRNILLDKKLILQKTQ
jgi:hypothetical protein